MQLPDALFRLLLEGGGGGREVCILVAEQLVGYFPRQQHPHVGMLVNPFAHQVHADGGADGGDVPGAQQLHHSGQGVEDILFGDNNLRVVAADIVGHDAGVF